MTSLEVKNLVEKVDVWLDFGSSDDVEQIVFSGRVVLKMATTFRDQKKVLASFLWTIYKLVITNLCIQVFFYVTCVVKFNPLTLVFYFRY